MNDTFLYRDRNWLFEQMIIFGKTEKQLSQEFGWAKRVIEKWVQIYGFGDNNFKNLNDFEFAIWMLDDGYRDKWTWDLCLGNLSEEEKLEVERFLLQKNLSFVYRKDRRYIRFYNQATRVIDEIILNNIPNDLDIINNKIRKGGYQQNG